MGSSVELSFDPWKIVEAGLADDLHEKGFKFVEYNDPMNPDVATVTYRPVDEVIQENINLYF